jgi:hypothetical protein
MDYLAESDHQKAVREFMEKAGQHTPAFVGVPDENVRYLRAKLIAEEAAELVRALGFDVSPMSIYKLTGKTEANLVEIADGAADLRVVTTGTLISCGIPDHILQRMVDLSNLRKFDGDFSFNEDGKLIKPDDWTAPPIEKLLHNIGIEQRKVFGDYGDVEDFFDV